MAYYCIIRHLKPMRVIEVGSGFSTLVALEALERNGVGALTCIEPFPLPWLERLLDRRCGTSLIKRRVQDISPEFFNRNLVCGDVLFIDSTHTVKAGSDCLHLYLRVLPQIEHHIMVHAHDIHLPFPLPQRDFDRHVYWTEQYLLYAYLLDNPKVRVVFGSVYTNRFLRDGLTKLMSAKRPAGGGSIWFRLDGRSVEKEVSREPC
jgi:hypothetical protein